MHSAVNRASLERPSDIFYLCFVFPTFTIACLAVFLLRLLAKWGTLQFLFSSHWGPLGGSNGGWWGGGSAFVTRMNNESFVRRL